MVLEVATAEDADAIAELEAVLFPSNNFNEVTIAHELKVGCGWVLYEDKTLVAFLYGRRVNDSLFDILRLGVSPARQNRGMGTLLLKRALQECCEAMLVVLKSNQGAIRQYRRHGFHITGELTHAPAWVMRTTSSAVR
jgi:ribosomal protein S18 acetylase RimI-like enzyme